MGREAAAVRAETTRGPRQSSRSRKFPVPWGKQAVELLRSKDPVLAAIIERVGPLNIAYRRERFQALVRAIIFQQLAGRAALAIYQRFVKIVGGGRFPTPEGVLGASDEAMRRAGLSRGKIGYIRDLARHIRDGTLNFHRFPSMTDEQIIAELIRVRGIGRWTAEMFLMFNLRRPDVLPVGDLGLRSAVAKAYGMRQLPVAQELKRLAERWRPYRTAAVWYLWQSSRVMTMDSQGRGARAPEKQNDVTSGSSRSAGRDSAGQPTDRPIPRQNRPITPGVT